jgi:hypothetical protein
VKTQLDYSLFAYSDRVYIGADHWLFYREVIDVGKPAVQGYSDAEVDGIVEQFRRLNRWLTERGVTLVILDNQLKDVFYPEMLPPGAVRLPAPSRYDAIRGRLRRETGAVFMDSTEILRKLQPERLVFHRTDFHWNDPAAFEVSRQLVDRLAALMGPPAAGWHVRLEIERRRVSGGEAAFMPLLRPIEEDALYVRKTWDDSNADVVLDEGGFSCIQRQHVVLPNALPPVVVLGDSFFDGMVRSGLPEHFAAVYRARLNDTSLQQVLNAFPADARFMIVQFIETVVGQFSIPLDFPTALSNPQRHR